MKQYLKDRFGSVALHIVSVDDNLNDAIPHLLADVVPSNANEVEDGVYIPGVVHGIFLCQYGHFKHLNETAQSKRFICTKLTELIRNHHSTRVIFNGAKCYPRPGINSICLHSDSHLPFPL